MRNGFSLVELSIVLVILGLLVGGVMSGQSLIKAAELRSVTSEFQQWQTAVNVFKDKYFALPGDMPNATAFWTADSGCGTGGAGSNTEPGYLGGSAMDGTCNGNNDGLIRQAGTERYEMFLFWHHLQLAGLISGNYTGVRGVGSNHHVVMGENSPRSKFTNGGWMVAMYPGSDTRLFDVEYGNMLILGSSLANSHTWAPLLTPEEAWNIDTKMDDGKPGRGNAIAYYQGSCTDAASDSDYDADYSLSDSNVRCAMIFRQAF